MGWRLTHSPIFARVAEELESGLLPCHGFVLRVHRMGARNPVWQQGRWLRDHFAASALMMESPIQ